MRDERERLTREQIEAGCERYVDQQLEYMQQHGGLREPLSPEQRQAVVQKVIAATTL